MTIPSPFTPEVRIRSIVGTVAPVVDAGADGAHAADELADAFVAVLRRTAAPADLHAAADALREIAAERRGAENSDNGAIDRAIEERRCVSTGVVSHLLGCSSQDVDQLVRAKALLGLPGPGGRRLFPAWQFAPTRPLAGIPEVRAALGIQDSWAESAFFLVPSTVLAGARPIDALRVGDIASACAAAAAHGIGMPT
jgi:hypothetical protein